MARVKIGDIIEIKTKTGFFYAQYTHKDSISGAVIQVAKKCYATRPENINEAIDGEVGIITLFPLSIAVHRKIFEVITNIKVPKSHQKFPIFREPGFIDKNGKVKKWKFWDGEKSWPVKYLDEITDDQKKLPIYGIWNDTLLIHRLETGWTPEQFIGDK